MLVLLLNAGTAAAHMPYWGGDWTGPNAAYYVEDTDISIVVYHEVRCEAPELWLTFDAVEGQEVWLELGVPVVDRLDDYRPALAVLAPGLPELEPDRVPFAVPEGLGGIVYEAGDDRSEFYEPFTATESWIYLKEWVEIPADGTGYVVGWDPSNHTGKLWIAVGTVEDFSGVDWVESANWMEAVNDFHETGVFTEVTSIQEEACEQEDAAEGGEQQGLFATRCGVSPMPNTAWVMVLVGLCIGLRRRGVADELATPPIIY